MSMKPPTQSIESGMSRRHFVRNVAAAGAALGALSMPSSRSVYAAGSDTLRIGLIGCGGRGLHDGGNFLQAAPGIELVAMGDTFEDRLSATLKSLKDRHGDKVKVTPETAFVGFDAYQKVLACDVDLVILTTPPHFRPLHIAAAVAAGVHIFAEKPVAVDPVGIRSVIESAEKAKAKNLTIVAGTQARRMEARRELAKRIHGGDIGEIKAVECVRTGGGMTGWGLTERGANMTDMEWHLRRWLFLTWLSGDFIDEMHVHELDIVNWMVGAAPERCYLLGGRSTRIDPLYGDSFDHFAGDFYYPNGILCSYKGTQIDGGSHKTFERFIGTKGTAYTDWGVTKIEGAKAWEFDGEAPNPELRQHAEQIDAIRNNKALNEAVQVAESSMTAIMGRMSAYTGREVQWRWAMRGSKLDLTPKTGYQFGPLPWPEVAIPGKTPLV